jgi:protein-S-isoprenylcysteine O-methyltransferase Ste14
MAGATMLALHFLLPVAMLIPFPWRLCGLALLAAGVLLNILADQSLKRHHTTVKPFERSTTLITDGVFSISRNPMYIGMALFLAGIAVFLGSLSPWFMVAVFIALIDQVFILREELKLRETFGSVYEEYEKSVRRWF